MVSDIFFLVEGEVFVGVIRNKYVDRCFAPNLMDTTNDVYIRAFSLEVLSSVMKYAICSSMMGPLILFGTTPLCHGGILSVDFTVPIVAFHSHVFL